MFNINNYTTHNAPSINTGSTSGSTSTNPANDGVLTPETLLAGRQDLGSRFDFQLPLDAMRSITFTIPPRQPNTPHSDQHFLNALADLTLANYTFDLSPYDDHGQRFITCKPLPNTAGNPFNAEKYHVTLCLDHNNWLKSCRAEKEIPSESWNPCATFEPKPPSPSSLQRTLPLWIDKSGLHGQKHVEELVPFPLELIRQVVGYLPVNSGKRQDSIEKRHKDFSALTLTNKHIRWQLGSEKLKMQALKEAARLVRNNIRATTGTLRLKPEQQAKVNAVRNMAGVSEVQQDEILDRHFRPQMNLGARGMLRIHPINGEKFRNLAATLADLPPPLRDAALDCFHQQILNRSDVDRARWTDLVLQNDPTIAADTAIKMLDLPSGEEGRQTWDQKAQAMLDFLTESARRPPVFQSLALQSAVVLISGSYPAEPDAPEVCGQRGVRTYLFDTVLAQANQLPSKYRDQVHAVLLAKIDRLPEANRESRRSLLT